MTPKEKAKELFDKMYNTEHCGIEHFPNKNYCDCVEINYHQAKQCALIAVDEMIELCDSYVAPYYYEVKKEIENL